MSPYRLREGKTHFRRETTDIHEYNHWLLIVVSHMKSERDIFPEVDLNRSTSFGHILVEWNGMEIHWNRTRVGPQHCNYHYKDLFTTDKEIKLSHKVFASSCNNRSVPVQVCCRFHLDLCKGRTWIMAHTMFCFIYGIALLLSTLTWELTP